MKNPGPRAGIFLYPHDDAYTPHDPLEHLSWTSGSLRGAAAVADLHDAALHRMETPMQRHASMPMDLGRCSLVMLAEELGEGRLLSTDARLRWLSMEEPQTVHPFAACRWKGLEALGLG